MTSSVARIGHVGSGRKVGESGAARILDRADQFLARAGGSPAPADQYREIYHAALRGAAALLAARETGVRRPTRNAWLRLAKAAPGYAEWVAYFTSVSGVVAALETSARTVTAEEVATLHGRVQTFLNQVEADLAPAA
ncbi:SAV_6107 family HEPN domain-containing protein [Tsukamurella sp. 1534]|uniref:SAV_6107 family HEPN domain-containing protein n=1 Tax=Tsukamurella sp. 1534 TaxID=1151061 RepID=UPI0003012E83|nr:SAV_6107 family HEPN domain-containing protein [Tsukamurella sp. 1534]